MHGTRTHYPRTPHLPWSPGASPDDVRAADLSGLAGREVVVTEKLDGENTTLYADGLHARSLDSAHHPSRAWVKALHGRIARRIPEGWRVCGENVHARHSLPYEGLESWFYAFSVWAGDRCLGWDETVRFARRLGVPVPPVLWRGRFDERALRALRVDPGRQEGYVVRAAGGFAREEFALRVAKWVRPSHVRTGEHWMLAPVVPNGLGPAAALWEVRSGAAPHVPSLLAAVGLAGPGAAEPAVGPAADPAVGPSADPALDPAPGAAADSAAQPAPDPRPDGDRTAEVVAAAAARLDLLGRSGDARLTGVLAALLHGSRRARLAPRLVPALGMRQARRTADLVGLHTALHLPYPDQDRRAGLVRLSAAADLGVLHAVAAAALAGRGGEQAAAAREQTEWSALHAEDAGLLDEDPWRPLRTGLREALAELSGPGAADAADRCWAEAREGFALGRIAGAAEAAALTWRWRSGAFPRLVHLSGPAGSGKSTFAAALPGVDARIGLDDLREARGARAGQRDNAAVLREALDRLDAALARGGTAVWDATSLNNHQRSLVQAVARRRDALVTHAVVLADPGELARRNAARAHPVPPAVLAAQLARFSPPYPGQAHRTWYIGAGGTVEDTAGTLYGEED